MRILVLTSLRHGIASRVLPALCASPQLVVTGVVLAQGPNTRSRSHLAQKLRKTFRIGVLGALNGIRMRKWYADPGSEDIQAVCQRLDIPLHETPGVNTDQTRATFREMQADLGLSLGNGYIAASVFGIPRFGMINIHTEILPQYRGAQSVIWPIHDGVKETGFTLHQIDARIDHGAILHQERYSIVLRPTLRETVERSLEEGNARIPNAFRQVCENFESLRAKAIPQGAGRSHTTPTIQQYWRMVRNHRRMLAEAGQR